MATVVDSDQKLDPSVQSNDIDIQWEDLHPVLQTQTSSHNKAKGVQVHTTNISNQNSIIASKINYQQISIGNGAAFTSATAGALAVSTYAVDLAVEQVFMETLGAELIYAAGVGAWGGVIGAGIAVTTVLGQAGYIYYKQQVENSKLQTKKIYNGKVKLINQKLKELKIKENKVQKLKKNLEIQEASINNYTFSIERRGRKSCKVIVAIGPTGYGKSLFCNRMMGNKDDIGDIEDAVNSDYIVADYGSTSSQTSDLTKVIKKIHIEYNNNNNNNNKSSFVLSVVDTPGAFDSNGNDIHYQNKMAEYFRACGGINIFCIFFKLGLKVDNNYQKLLKLYERFWGKDMWKRCVVVITNCDMDSTRSKKQTKKGLPKTVKGIKDYLNKVSNGLCNNVPIYEFGEENYTESTKNLLLSLIDPVSVFYKKYSCKNITAPINTLWNKLELALSDYKLLIKEIDMLKKQMDKLKKELQ